MKKYIKDQTLGLMYVHKPEGWPINNIPFSVVSSENEIPLVISARGSHVSFRGPDWENGLCEVKFSNRDSSVLSYQALYEYLYTLNANQIDDLFKLNDFPSEFLAFRDSSSSVQFSMVLFELDHSLEDQHSINEFLETLDETVVRVSIGGSELIIDYLLSSFCESTPEDSSGDKENEISDFILKRRGKHSSGNRYNFSYHNDFNHLSSTYFEWDFELPDNGYEINRTDYYYRLDKKVLEKIGEELIVPPRIEQILPEDIKLKIPNLYPKLIHDREDMIVRDVFKGQYDSFKEDYARRRRLELADNMSAQWAQGVYDSGVADDAGRVYLSDGFYLDSNGNLED